MIRLLTSSRRCGLALLAVGLSASLWTAAAIAAMPASTDTSSDSDAERMSIEELRERLAMSEHEFDTVIRIIDEGTTRNRVMEHLTHLCEEIGPRLTGSTRLEQANKWVAQQFESFGLANVHQSEWGTIAVRFDRGPSSGRMTKPVEREFEFTTRAWSAGTPKGAGPIEGRVFREPMSHEEFDAVADELKGAWILRSAVAPQGTRRGVVPGVDETREFLTQLRDAGIAGLIVASRDELVRTGGARGWRELDFSDLPTDVTVEVRRSDYDAINSRLADGEEVHVAFELNHTFVEGPIPCYNTIGEIRGTERPDEIVIISGHLDSWDGPGSRGTVDNGTGSSVTIEAARILMAAGVKPKRTIRFILWTGEEQGLLGSRAYVESLSDEEKANISAVFVDDSGTNRESGLAGIEDMRDMLERAIAPINYAFPEMPVEYRVLDRMPRGGGSDHASFNREGIPGFFWDKEGRADYRYAWHTQNDRLDQAIPEYLVQNSTASALVAYVVANAESLLPRQVLTEEQIAEHERQRQEWRDRRRRMREEAEGATPSGGEAQSNAQGESQEQSSGAAAPEPAGEPKRD